MRLFDDDLYWVQVNDGNEAAFQIYQRHYTYRKGRKRDLNKNKKNGKRMAGPGETIVLLGKDGKALFIWKKQKYSQDGQVGINCCLFRNEGEYVSSDLILQAERVAQDRWPGSRMFTYVNPRKIRARKTGMKIRKSKAGACFKHAGWVVCGVTKARKYIILEKTF